MSTNKENPDIPLDNVIVQQQQLDQQNKKQEEKPLARMQKRFTRRTQEKSANKTAPKESPKEEKKQAANPTPKLTNKQEQPKKKEQPKKQSKPQPQAKTAKQNQKQNQKQTNNRKPKDTSSNADNIIIEFEREPIKKNKKIVNKQESVQPKPIDPNYKTEFIIDRKKNTKTVLLTSPLNPYATNSSENTPKTREPKKKGDRKRITGGFQIGKFSLK